MVRKKIIVFGWYGHGNLGDEAFRTSFQQLWPQFDFEFTDQWDPAAWNGKFDGLFIGAGSILDTPLTGLSALTIPYALIGVSIGQTLIGTELASKMKLAVLRDKASENLIASDPSVPTFVAPDLVFANPFVPDRKLVPEEKRAVIILNDFLAPKHTNLNGAKEAWDWFCHEFRQVCDQMMEDGWSLMFVPMGTGAQDDRRAAAHVIGMLKHPEKAGWLFDNSEELVHQIISESTLVITQRFHGMVYAAQAGRPFIGISAHDKLDRLANHMACDNMMTGYYGFNKGRFFSILNGIMNNPTKHGSYVKWYAERAREQCQAIAADVAQKFFG